MSNTLPKISIITPTYNQGKYIEKTILSVLDQNYTNLEFIIIDGGSKDQTVEIIRKYEKQLTFWVSEKDKGQSDAINKGLAKATGDVITWLNSDDYYLPNVLHLIANQYLTNPDKGVFYGKTILFNSEGDMGTLEVNKESTPHVFWGGMAFSQPSSFFTKEALNLAGRHVDENLHYGMDYDLFVRIYLHKDFLGCDDVLSKYLHHVDSKTAMTNVGFAKDWTTVFSNLAQTIDSAYLIEQLKSIDLFTPTHSYTLSKKLSAEDQKLALFYFLKYQFFFYYEDLEISKAKQIGNYICANYPELAQKFNIPKTVQRTKLPFSKFLIKTLRNVSR